MFKMKFLTGLGIGYVLGARAGRDGYDKLVHAANQAAGQPRLQKFLGAGERDPSDRDPSDGDASDSDFSDAAGEGLGSDSAPSEAAVSPGSAASGAPRPARGATPAGTPPGSERGAGPGADPARLS